VVVLERGVVVTSGASDPVVGGAGVTKVAVAGTTGVFSVVVDGLQYGTGYRFRAYATSAGGTAYSAVGTFTTLNLAVTGVAAVQRAGTRLVDIDYGVVGMTGPMDVILEASADGGVTWTVPVATVSGAVGSGVAAGAGLRITWDAGTDWGSQYSQTMRFRVSVRTSLGTFAEVSAGGFTMGDALDGDPQAPLRSVQLSRFFMEKQIVTKARWDEVRSWALTNGYGDLGAGEGKAADHPVVSVSWQDAVKFCNARSEREGLVPVYSAAGAVLRTGAAVPVVNWDASGYRLPTEAEWEKAARGGLSGKRFPWGDTITHAQANYYSSSLYGYDVSTTRGYHPVYRVGSQPWTSPAGAFAPNGYGFQDMAGNVWQWCWDWYGAYPGGALNDPRGAATGTERVARGGAWLYYADYCPSSRRRYFTPDYAANVIGLRLVRSVVPVLTATAGTGNVTVSTSDPVQITSQPADLTVVETASAVFTVTATGTGPLSYQWRRDGVALPGQSGPALTLAPVRLEDAARYSVAVTNLTGTLLSREALLVVRPASAADVVAVQRPGSKLIDVTYSIPGNPGPVLVMLQASADGGVSWNVPVRTVTGSVGAGVLPGTGLKITWDAGADWNEQASANMRFRVLVEPARAGLSLIPPGLFTMGDSLDGSEEPHPVTVSAFHLAQRPVTSAEWGEVRTWATSRGYSDLAAGEGKAGNHPIVGVTWWDVVKWCNARSERDGLTPCYTSGGNVFKTGTVVPSVSWSANGYRLPTEAEWEKAARGGLAGKRFPWGDTITHAQANYFSDAALPYDQSPTRGYHPQWGTGAQPWSSPVGTYGANAYGLTDMAGNVWQWCWDWFGPYDLEVATDPRGASQGADRIFRGGGWGNSASLCRSAFRGYYPPTYRSNAIGFRVARIPAPAVTGTSVSGQTAINTNDPPVITAQPPDQTLMENTEAVLAVAVSGSGPLTFSWTRNGDVIGGASGATLVIPRLKLSDAGGYAVTITNPAGSVSSRTAVLTVNPQPGVVVRAAQRPGSRIIDIDYDLIGMNGPVQVTVSASSDGGLSWDVPLTALSGDLGPAVTGGTGRRVTWDAGADWNRKFAAGMLFRVKAEPEIGGSSMIPSGRFTMGDSLDGSEEPHPVEVSSFYLAQRPVTSAEWSEVRTWASSRGYSDLAAGEGKAGNHPVVGVTWWDVVKWCNARSERDGLTPCYTSGGNVFKTGTVVPSVSWSANGYRLPTEAEWEKAARGGLSGKRFPWGDTITHAQANYFSDAALPYDQSPTRGYHPQWGTGAQPWSSPVGTYGANAYGLTDMAGNVWQWCWDWFGPYDLEAATDPRGASQGSDRIFRGGGWGNSASLCRSAFRGYYPPTYRSNAIGFRVARSSVLNGVSAGAQVHTGAQYGIVPADHTWQSAADDAGRRGGRLAIVSTEARIARVQSVLDEFGAARHGSLWIALSREAGSWRWSDGEPLAAANWAPGQPSAWGSRAWILGTGENRGKWTSQETAMAGYVIEFPWSELKPGAPVANGAVTGYGDYEPGTSAVLTAAAAPGFRFEGWTGDATGLENPLTVLMDRSRVISPQFVPDVPDLSVEQPDGVVIAPNGILDGFRTTKPSERIIVRSSGSGTLRGVAWELRGTASADYLVSPALPGTMAPGTSAELEIRFTPSAPGMRDAELRIASNDADGPFVIFLRGRESTASEVWRHTHFGTPENAGEAADASDPDRDGISNLMEFATGSHPKEFSPDPGEVVRNGGVLEYRYWRAKSALAELNFVREFATGPTGPWSQTGGLVETILSDDGSRQRILVTTPASAAIEKRFVRLRVSRK
jgi:formylglycine-generating enzyme required for sulfatase activity